MVSYSLPEGQFTHTHTNTTVCFGSTNNLTFVPNFSHEKFLKYKIQPRYAIQRGTMYSVPWPNFEFEGCILEKIGTKV